MAEVVAEGVRDLFAAAVGERDVQHEALVVTGRVLDKKGQPLREARVTIQGGDKPVLTNANGVFTLDSLPSGTQSLEVRKLGYAVAEVPVELSTIAPATANVTMSDVATTSLARAARFLEHKYNGGEPFRQRTSELKGGRPIK